MEIAIDRNLFDKYKDNPRSKKTYSEASTLNSQDSILAEVTIFNIVRVFIKEQLF